MKQQENLILRRMTTPDRPMQIGGGMAFLLTGEGSVAGPFPESTALLWAVNQKPAFFLLAPYWEEKKKLSCFSSHSVDR